MKNNSNNFFLTLGIIHICVIVIYGEVLHIVPSLVLTCLTMVLYICLCIENNNMNVSKIFFIKDFCVLVMWNLAILNYIKNRYILYPLYIVIMGIGLYCLYYLYKVENGYKKLNAVEEARHAEWREKFKGDKQMEEFFAPEEKEEGEDTFAKKGLKHFFSYMFLPCAITLLGDVLEIIIGSIK